MDTMSSESSFDPSDAGGSAVVVGAGLGGLLSARVLSEHFRHVVILERDELPLGPEYRSGVPQARHVHILMSGGLRAISRLFPGLCDELAVSGARPADAAADWRSHFGSGWLPQFHAGLACLTVSRTQLDWCVRRRVEALPNVEIRSGCQVTGLQTEDPLRTRSGVGGGLRVTGVRIASAGGKSNVGADLVLDCSGRGSQAPKWFCAAGLGAPAETVINAHLGYASRWYEPLAEGREQQHVLVMLNAPDVPRGGVVCPVEGGRWVATLSGTSRDYPPTDEAGFLDFAAGAAQPTLADAIRDARPATAIFGYRRTENRWRHFERLRRWPEGFVVLGDALCTFNPVYGQGMSVAALSAEALEQWLGRRSQRRGYHGFGIGAHAFQRRLKRILAVPWMLATGEDFRWTSTDGPRPAVWLRLMHRYMDHVMALAVVDRRICTDFLRVLHLVAKPYILFAPHTLWRVLVRAMTRDGESRGPDAEASGSPSLAGGEKDQQA